MRKHCTRLLSLMLVLVMTFALLPTFAVTADAAEEQEIVTVIYRTSYSYIEKGREDVKVDKGTTVLPVESLKKIPEGWQVVGEVTINGRFATAIVEPIQAPKPDPDNKVPVLNKEDHVAYIRGYEDGTFRPQGKITRAEVVAIINRMCERATKAANMLIGAATFPDVHSSDWFYEDVLEASNAHEFVLTNERVDHQIYCYEQWTSLYK